MTELDKAIADLQSRLDEIDRAILNLNCERARIEGEIKGINTARKWFGPEVADDRAPRYSVQKPVMALFGPEKATWTEAGIAEQTGLPRGPIHEFIIRAVRTGMLRRLPTYAPGDPEAEYGLARDGQPQEMTDG